jgi:hypothetical protein
MVGSGNKTGSRFREQTNNKCEEKRMKNRIFKKGDGMPSWVWISLILVIIFLILFLALAPKILEILGGA